VGILLHVPPLFDLAPSFDPLRLTDCSCRGPKGQTRNGPHVPEAYDPTPSPLGRNQGDHQEALRELKTQVDCWVATRGICWVDRVGRHSHPSAHPKSTRVEPVMSGLGSPT